MAHGEGEESSSDREALASGDAHGWAMQRTVDGKCAKQGGSPRASIFAKQATDARGLVLTVGCKGGAKVRWLL